MGLHVTTLPVVTKDLPISPRFTSYDFLSRCKFSTLTTRQPMVEFYLLTFPRFPLRKKEHKSYFGKNRTHDFRTSRCAGYLLDEGYCALFIVQKHKGRGRGRGVAHALGDRTSPRLLTPPNYLPCPSYTIPQRYATVMIKSPVQG